MSDLNYMEKRKPERAVNMGSGYVIDFSNRTFQEFFHDSIGIDIYDSKYNYNIGSKANRMRAFWDLEPNCLVGKLLDDLFSNWEEFAHGEWNDYSEVLLIFNHVTNAVKFIESLEKVSQVKDSKDEIPF